MLNKDFMPAYKPSIATMILFSFVWTWNDYMSPYLYISDINKQMLSVGIKLFLAGQSSGLRFTNGGGYTCIAADNRSIPVLSEILY